MSVLLDNFKETDDYEGPAPKDEISVEELPYNLPGEKLDDFDFPKRLADMSEKARRCYSDFNLEGKIDVDFTKLTEGCECLHGGVIGLGRSEIFISSLEKPKKVIKISPVFYQKDLSEGPCIRVCKFLLEEEGIGDVGIFPKVYEHGILTDGRRYVVTEKIEGRRPFNFREDTEIPKVQDFIAAMQVLITTFPMLERHGISLSGDMKPYDFFFESSGRIRKIDFDVTRMDSPDELVGSPSWIKPVKAITNVFVSKMANVSVGEASSIISDMPRLKEYLGRKIKEQELVDSLAGFIHQVNYQTTKKNLDHNLFVDSMSFYINDMLLPVLIGSEVSPDRVE